MININICHRCAWPNSWTPWGILPSHTSLPEADSTQGRYQVRLVVSIKYEVPNFTVLQHDLYVIQGSDVGINQRGVMNQEKKNDFYGHTQWFRMWGSVRCRDQSCKWSWRKNFHCWLKELQGPDWEISQMHDAQRRNIGGGFRVCVRAC